MRILHVVHQYLPEQIGGTELYTHWLTQELSGRDHELAIFHRRSAAGAGVHRRRENKVEVWSAWNGRFQPTNHFLSTFRNPPLQKAFIDTLDTFNPHVVHIEHLMGLPVTLLTTLQRRRIPYIVTLHDFWWVCANAQLITNDTQEVCAGPDRFRNCARCAVARSPNPALRIARPVLTAPLSQRNRLLKNGLRHAACLIAPAPFVQNWYTDHDIPTTHMTVVHPGLDYPADIPEHHEKSRPFRIGYIGGLASQKGVHTLIKAFTNLSTPLPDQPAELWIAGDLTVDPDYVIHLRQLAAENVRFLGQLDRDVIWKMLAELDVVVVPSLWYETFCFVISEAFSVGVPVIASDLGVLADRVRPGVDGLLFPPGDARALTAILGQCRDDPELLPRLQANIKPGPTVAQHTDQIEAIYQHVTSHRAKDSGMKTALTE